MLRAYVGRITGLRKERILPILQRSEARLRGTVTDAAFVDFASRVGRPLRDEIIAVGWNVRHADAVQPVPSVATFPPANPDNDITAPAATGHLVAARIRKQRPGPKPEDHTEFYRIIIETLRYYGELSDDKPEISLDDDNLSRIVEAADSNDIKPPGRRPTEYERTPPPYSSWAVYLADSKEACRKAIRNRIKWAIGQLQRADRAFDR